MNFQESSPHLPVRTREPVTAARARRVAMIAGAILAGVFAILYAYTLVREHMVKSFLAANKPPPVAVTYETVTPAALPQYLTAAGSIAAVHQVAVAPEVSGSVTKILFAPGAAVKKGDLLVQLNDAPELADLAAMRAQQRLAQVALERQRHLIESGFVSKAQLDQAQSQYDAATANIARIQALIAQKQVRAPFDGVLSVRQAETGQYLNAGTTVTWVTQPSPLYINFTLPEQTMPRLTVGQTIEFTVDAHPDRTFTATLAVVDPQIMADTRTVKLQAVAENPDNVLTPGMFANVKVVMPPRANTITVPETAVSYTVDSQSVYVIRQETDPATNAPILKVQRVPVETGERQNNRIAVTGLKAGDKVVTTGQVRLFEGAVVTLGAQAPPASPSPHSLN